MRRQPPLELSISLQLSYLQTIIDMGSDKTTSLVLPLPLELLRPFIEKGEAPKDVWAPPRPGLGAARLPRAREGVVHPRSASGGA